MKLLLLSFFFALSLILSLSLSSSPNMSPSSSESSFISLMSYIEKESAMVSNAQHSVREFLNSKNIPVGQSKVSTATKRMNSIKHLVTLSTDSNPVDCRVSLERAPIGSKCLAPCGCTGSQKWVQFSLLNKLRRKDPEQWKICRTCQKPFDYSAITKFGGIEGNALSAVLDNIIVVRCIIFTFGAITSLILNLPALVISILVSQTVWKLYPRWSRIIHLPFVFQLWGGKVILQYLTSFYLGIEKNIILYLTDIETQIIEPKLPVTVASISEPEST